MRLLDTCRDWLQAPLPRRFALFRTLDRLAFRYTSRLAYELLAHSEISSYGDAHRQLDLDI